MVKEKHLEIHLLAKGRASGLILVMGARAGHGDGLSAGKGNEAGAGGTALTLRSSFRASLVLWPR